MKDTNSTHRRRRRAGNAAGLKDTRNGRRSQMPVRPHLGDDRHGAARRQRSKPRPHRRRRIFTADRQGCADAIIAFEPAEAVRAFPYLKKGGSVTVSSSPVKPVTDSLADKPYSADDMIEFLEKQDIRLTVVDGGEIIREAGSAKSLNAALIAAACASGAVPFSVEEIENVVRNELKAEIR